MKLEVEVVPNNSMILIVGDPHIALVKAVISYYKMKDARVVIASHIPPKLSENITTCYCFTHSKYLAEDAVDLSKIRNVVIVSSLHRQANAHVTQTLNLIAKHYPTVKVALIPEGNHDIPTLVERLIYFSFEEKIRNTIITSPAILQQQKAEGVSQHTHTSRPQTAREIYISIIKSPLRFIGSMLILLLIVHLLFLVPLSYASVSVLWRVSNIAQKISRPQSIEEKIQDPFASSSQALELSRSLYDPIRRGWLFVGLASYPESLFEVVDRTIGLYHTVAQIRDDSSIMLSLMLDPRALAQEQIATKQKDIKSNLDETLESLQIIRSQLPSYITSLEIVHTGLEDSQQYLRISSQLLGVFDKIFAKNSERIYAIFFANDRELRPGGGFIGSFALIKVQNLQIKEWKVYDVYDADGQLKARVPPPEPISKYLKQPFFFLRDSAFTPDFPTNVIVAQDFLQKELGIDKLDGAFLFTFSSIEKLIGAIGPISLPEYQDTITDENVYIKTQMYAERNFFPGSTQKKNFLEALMLQIILRLEEPKTAFNALQSIQQSLNQKLITVYFQDSDVQSLFDTLYWSGRQLPPSCIQQGSPTNTCIPMYVYPVEANLGVNKSNAFISRTYEFSAKVLPDTHAIDATFSTRFSNSSYGNAFPGGTYKNYYQIFLPPDVAIQSLTVDNMIAKNPDIEKAKYTRVGLWLSIPPQSSQTVTLAYRTKQSLPKEKSQIQIIFQKQIGMPTTDISFKFGLPEGYTITETNFSPLAQDRIFEYNSAVDSDKFYYLHF